MKADLKQRVKDFLESAVAKLNAFVETSRGRFVILICGVVLFALLMSLIAPGDC